MYKLTKNVESQFIKLFGFSPDSDKLKRILSECYCVQFFKIYIKERNLYLVRPELYFHPKTESVFVCDRYKRKIFAIYKADKGLREV